MVIKKIIKPPIMALLKMTNLYSLFLLRQAGPLSEDGWFRSFRENAPVDASGNPLPWITYPAIEFLASRVNKEMSVFEYGCGASTLWWARLVKEVVSVEHDKDWFDIVASRAPHNVDLHHIPLAGDDAYQQAVGAYRNRFHLLILDGRKRVECASHSLDALTSDGVIIWDNSDREEYRQGYEFLFSHGFRKIEFVGYAPGCIDKTETAFFYRDRNCLGI